jgi:hypothetical protein
LKKEKKGDNALFSVEVVKIDITSGEREEPVSVGEAAIPHLSWRTEPQPTPESSAQTLDLPVGNLSSCGIFR